MLHNITICASFLILAGQPSHQYLGGGFRTSRRRPTGNEINQQFVFQSCLPDLVQCCTSVVQRASVMERPSIMQGQPVEADMERINRNRVDAAQRNRGVANQEHWIVQRLRPPGNEIRKFVLFQSCSNLKNKGKR